MIAAMMFVGYQIYGVIGEYRQLSGEMTSIKTSADDLSVENEGLRERVQYLSEPENLINEIKSKFNYRFPDERTIIVAPER
jgi:hypothetical protein